MKLPSLLSYTRTINPSVGVFFAVENLSDWNIKEKRQPIEITKVGLVTTISNYTTDPDKALEKSGKNLQQTEMALVPDSCNYAGMEFSLNISNNFKNPNNCNDKEFRKVINNFVEDYIKSGKSIELSKLYLQNILTARFMFRNLFSSNKMKVFIKTEDKNFEFEVFSNVHDLSQFKNQEDVKFLLDELNSALIGEEVLLNNFKVKKILNWKITTLFEINSNSEIYPSQEFIEGAQGKILTTIKSKNDIQQAAYHAQKIGNAIRTVDIWYNTFNEEDKQYPIPAEPYGIDRTSDSVLRKKESLYYYLENLESKLNDDNKHYVISCLIRGGVFSGAKEKK